MRAAPTDAASTGAVATTSGFDAQNPANTLRRSGALVLEGAPASTALQLQTLRIAGEYTMQELSNSAWAIATLPSIDPPLLDAIAGAAY